MGDFMPDELIPRRSTRLVRTGCKVQLISLRESQCTGCPEVLVAVNAEGSLKDGAAIDFDNGRDQRDDV